MSVMCLFDRMLCIYIQFIYTHRVLSSYVNALVALSYFRSLAVSHSLALASFSLCRSRILVFILILCFTLVGYVMRSDFHLCTNTHTKTISYGFVCLAQFRDTAFQQIGKKKLKIQNIWPCFTLIQPHCVTFAHVSICKMANQMNGINKYIKLIIRVKICLCYCSVFLLGFIFTFISITFPMHHIYIFI